jgi:predicted DNA-binding transcriptional regulator AlpA
MPKVVVHFDAEREMETWDASGFPVGQRLEAGAVAVEHCPDCVRRTPGWGGMDLKPLRDHVVAEHNRTVEGSGEAWRGVLLTKREVLARLPFGQTTLWKLIGEGRFPKPVTVGGVGCWYERDVEIALARLATEGEKSGRGAKLKSR